MSQYLTIDDVIAADLRVLFCGINPGLLSGATGFHFARPGNRFWPTLHGAGFTPRLLAPKAQYELLSYGFGITNLVPRITARADQLSADELLRGGAQLQAKIVTYRPQVVAILGITAYRSAFGAPKAALGRQIAGLAGARLWVLPNPSGLNAHYTLPALIQVFREFGAAAGVL